MRITASTVQPEPVTFKPIEVTLRFESHQEVEAYRYMLDLFRRKTVGSTPISAMARTIGHQSTRALDQQIKAQLPPSEDF